MRNIPLEEYSSRSCPKCGTGAAPNMSLDNTEDTVHTEHLECPECGCEWVEVFTLSRVYVEKD